MMVTEEWKKLFDDRGLINYLITFMKQGPVSNYGGGRYSRLAADDSF